MFLNCVIPILLDLYPTLNVASEGKNDASVQILGLTLNRSLTSKYE